MFIIMNESIYYITGLHEVACWLCTSRWDGGILKPFHMQLYLLLHVNQLYSDFIVNRLYDNKHESMIINCTVLFNKCLGMEAMEDL